MRYAVLFTTLVACTSAQVLFERDEILTTVLRRQSDSEETYIASVCTPNITTPVPPCTEIISIQEQCQPNGTATIDYIAHQECMCNGGFFSNWNGCLNCQYVHGSRSEAVVEAFESIISSASSALCTGTPTTTFAAIFSSISNSAPQVATDAATALSDQYPSQSAVSLYYTASGPQGAGAITGSATSATRTDSTSSAVTASSDAAVDLGSSVSTTGTSKSSSAASSASTTSGTTTDTASSSKSTTSSSTSAGVHSRGTMCAFLTAVGLIMGWTGVVL